MPPPRAAGIRQRQRSLGVAGGETRRPRHAKGCGKLRDEARNRWRSVWRWLLLLCDITVNPQSPLRTVTAPLGVGRWTGILRQSQTGIATAGGCPSRSRLTEWCLSLKHLSAVLRLRLPGATVKLADVTTNRRWSSAAISS